MGGGASSNLNPKVLQRYNFGFSLVEILISLITISLILAAFAPVVSKRISKKVSLSDASLSSTQGCQSGQYKDASGSCLPCSAGYFCTGENKAICSDGTYSLEGAASCTICPAGSYCKEGVLKPCADKTYSLSGSTVCSDCITDGYVVNEAKTSCIKCPAGYKCVNGIKTACEGKTYSNEGQSFCSDCPSEGFVCINGIKYSCPQNCKTCTSSNECTNCSDGYKLNSSNKCQSNNTSPYIQLNLNGDEFVLSRYNIGDFVNGVGIDIPASAGVTILNADSTPLPNLSAGEVGDITIGAIDFVNGKYCWIGPTADVEQCNSDGGSYSGCSRTVCNWNAATAICSALGMSLLSQSQITNIIKLYPPSLADNGVQFCSATSTNLSSLCASSTNCKESGKCNPSELWWQSECSDNNGADEIQTFAVSPGLVGGGSTSSNITCKNNVKSVRCMSRQLIY